MDMNLQFSDLSIKLTNVLKLNDKKKGGIYFTPYSIANSNLSSVLKYIKNNNISIKNILEPSCGSMNFVDCIVKYFKDSKITGIELDETIYDEITRSYNNPNINIINKDYLKYQTDISYDLIIGNPPYFPIKKKDCDKEFLKFIYGRPNIFILFILHSLKLLGEGGILSFVLPNSFSNSSYYNNVREHIFNNYTIIDIINHKNEDSFKETKQKVTSLIIQNKKPDENNNSKFCSKYDNIILLNDISTINHIELLKKNSVTLNSLKCSVNTGTVVWNQVKDKLTDDETNTLLIYSGNIVNNKFKDVTFTNKDKKNYIILEGLIEPIIVVNRGYGNAKYKFQYSMISLDKPFLIENHLICIRCMDPDKKTIEDKKELLEKIIQSFNCDKTHEFIDLYCENNALSNNELQNIVPIYF